MVRAATAAHDRHPAGLYARVLSCHRLLAVRPPSPSASPPAEPMMLQTSSLLADSLADRLVATFVRSYGRAVSAQAELLGEAARLVIERLSLSDALYHTA